jgi:hypothetical protein
MNVLTSAELLKLAEQKKKQEDEVDFARPVKDLTSSQLALILQQKREEEQRKKAKDDNYAEHVDSVVFHPNPAVQLSLKDVCTNIDQLVCFFESQHHDLDSGTKSTIWGR